MPYRAPVHRKWVGCGDRWNGRCGVFYVQEKRFSCYRRRPRKRWRKGTERSPGASVMMASDPNRYYHTCFSVAMVWYKRIHTHTNTHTHTLIDRTMGGEDNIYSTTGLLPPLLITLCKKGQHTAAFDYIDIYFRFRFKTISPCKLSYDNGVKQQNDQQVKPETPETRTHKL